MSRSFFVSADWLAEHLHDSNLQILDARMAPAGQEAHYDIIGDYRRSRIPGAILFDIETLSDATSALPHTLPRPESFAVAMRELGICRDKLTVIYDDGTLFSAPRAWWMMKSFGAEHVVILGGGLPRWLAAGYTTEHGVPVRKESDFDVVFSPQVICKLTDVLLISHEKTAQLIDARPAARFYGEVDEPRPGLRRGHIPSARNVPWNTLTEQGELKSDLALREIFEEKGVDLTQPIVVSCGSGVTAAVVVLALATLGISSVPLYDGSWSEWGAREDLPIALG